MSFNINNTLLSKLFINKPKVVFNTFNKIIKYHEITRNKDWVCEFTYKHNYNNSNILMANILLYNHNLDLSYEELLYKDMNNNSKLLNNDFHILLKNRKEINITKIEKIFYKNFLKNKEYINGYIIYNN